MRRVPNEKARDSLKDRGPRSKRRRPDGQPESRGITWSGGKRAAAAAAARGVWILEGEARALHGRDVVDRDPAQILRRERVDEHAEASRIDDEVVVRSL